MYYNANQGVINQLERQKENIDNLLNQYSTPIQNIINTNSEYDVKFLKSDEDISNIPIIKKTIFFDESNKKITIKDIDSSIIKEYEIIIPLDEKDKKILELEKKIKELEDGYTKFDGSTNTGKEPSTNDNGTDATKQ